MIQLLLFTALLLTGCATSLTVTAPTTPTTATTAPASSESAVPRPEIIPAAAWGSQPQDMSGEIRHTPKRITLHHAGVYWKDGSNPYEKLQGLQKWGQTDKGWPDVPYHFLISPDGRIFAGRPVEYAGETNTQYDTRGHLLIQLWGNFNEQRVTQAQLESAVRLAAYLADKYDIDPDTIAGHNDVAPGQTECPGRDFDRYIDDGTFTKWVKALLNGRNPHITLRPPLPEGPTTFPSTQPAQGGQESQ